MFRRESPSPPSTPDYRFSNRNVPSTTPAGPPPDRSFTAQSSTPAGPPPATSLFGANSLRAPNFSRQPLGSSPPKNNGELFGVGSGSYGTSTTGRPGSQRGRSFRVPSDSPSSGEEDDDEMDEEIEVPEHESEDEDMDDEDAEGEEDEDDDSSIQGRARSNRFSQSVTSRTSDVEQSAPGVKIVRSSAKQSQLDLSHLAKALSQAAHISAIHDPAHIILGTERLMMQLHESQASDTVEKRDIVIAEVAQQIATLWEDGYKSSASKQLFTSSGTSPSNANRIVNLLLNLRCPPRVDKDVRQGSMSLIPTGSEPRHYKAIPKILLDYLNTYHSTVSEVESVLTSTRGYSAHGQFWDAIFISTLRGDFPTTIKLLKNARFEAAETSHDDGLGASGYGGSHLVHANGAANAALRILDECPAVDSDDWDIKGQDWILYRRRVQQAIDELHDYSEGESQSRHGLSRSFQASHFGMSQSQQFNLSIASRKAESKVPWAVYEGLNKLYRFLLGDEEEILGYAQDWFEGTLLLTVWWNGDEDDTAQGSLAASRRSMARSQRLRPVDVTPIQAYGQRLQASFAAIVESGDENYELRTTDAFQVGLACICDNNIEGVIQILRRWSLCLASAVAEIATTGEWLRKSSGVLDQFDASDLMVLSYNDDAPTGLPIKDDLLAQYAEVLATEDEVDDDEGNFREGWELSIEILGRIDNRQVAGDRIEALLDNLPLNGSRRVDKITQLCNSLDLSEFARRVAMVSFLSCNRWLG